MREFIGEYEQRQPADRVSSVPPEVFANDAERRKQAGVPEQIRFYTKPQIALEQIRQAVQAERTHRRSNLCPRTFTRCQRPSE
jgi:DDE superfamily endonuclease